MTYQFIYPSSYNDIHAEPHVEFERDEHNGIFLMGIEGFFGPVFPQMVGTNRMFNYL